MSVAIKIIPVVFFATVLVFVVWTIQPPDSFITASPLQLSSFFIPFFLFLVFLTNLYFKFYLKSAVFAFGITILLILKILDLLNLASFALTIIATIFIIKSIKKPVHRKFGSPKFAPQVKIPKLSRLEKQK